jgi:ribonuclease HII
LRTIAGVDEAGRGSVLGPLVVAGVAIQESKIIELSTLGVKDSKLLTPKKRRQLYSEIRKIADQIEWKFVEPAQIDKIVQNGIRLFKLNYLEAKCMAYVLSRLHFDLAYVDCCDTNQQRYGSLVSNLVFERTKKIKREPIELGEINPYVGKIKSEHHADRNHIVVSAASIVAKVRRDAYISRLHKIHGIFGSGYPSDDDTIDFLKGFVDRSESLPSITRLSWATIRNIRGESIVSNNPTIEESLRLANETT